MVHVVCIDLCVCEKKSERGTMKRREILQNPSSERNAEKQRAAWCLEDVHERKIEAPSFLRDLTPYVSRFSLDFFLKNRLNHDCSFTSLLSQCFHVVFPRGDVHQRLTFTLPLFFMWNICSLLFASLHLSGWTLNKKNKVTYIFLQLDCENWVSQSGSGRNQKDV